MATRGHHNRFLSIPPFSHPLSLSLLLSLSFSFSISPFLKRGAGQMECTCNCPNAVLGPCALPQGQRPALHSMHILGPGGWVRPYANPRVRPITVFPRCGANCPQHVVALFVRPHNSTGCARSRAKAKIFVFVIGNQIFENKGTCQAAPSWHRLAGK